MNNMSGTKASVGLLEDMESGLKLYRKFSRNVISLAKNKRYTEAKKLFDSETGGSKIRHAYDRICDDMCFSALPKASKIIINTLTVAKPLAAAFNVRRNFDSDIDSIKKITPTIEKYKTLGDGYSSEKSKKFREIDDVLLNIVNDVCTHFLDDVFAAIPGTVTEEGEDFSDKINRAFMEAGIGDYEKADMRYFMEAGLSDSLIFKKLNDSSNITQRIEQIVKSGTIVEKDFIEEQYTQMGKTRLSPLVDDVLKAYDEGDILLIYNKNIHLTIALPFTVMKMKGRYRALIFISDFSGVTKDGSALNIEMKKLYTIMEAALVGLRYYTNPALFSRSSIVAKMTATTYTEMCLRILNKEFALSLNKEAYDMVSYSLSRFYLEKVLGLTSADIIHSYARGICKSPDETNINIVQGMYDGASLNTVDELMSFFVQLYPKMEKLTFRYFFERWVSSYNIGATLAIDNFPYLYYTMISVLLGSFMVNNTALNDLIKNIKGMQHFHSEIARIV